MANAKKLPSGNWRTRASISVNGKIITKSFTAKTKKQAELKAIEWQNNQNYIQNDNLSYTFEEAIDEYCKLKSNILSPATIVGYKNIKKNCLKELEGCKLDKTSSIIIQKWINNLSADKSAKTVKNCYGLITAIYRQFAPDYIPRGICLPQTQKPKNRALNEQEIKLLLDNIEDNEIEIPVLLALWLGLRKSEILALKWSDVDFDNHRITIDKALVRNEFGKYVEKPPKTAESERILTLPKFIEDKLKSLNRTAERIFPQLEKCLNTRWFRFSEKIGLNCKFHDLRRTMATLGVKLNISDRIMMSRGGWSNPQTMKLIYQQALSEDVDSADTRINEYMLNLIDTCHETCHKNENTA